MSIRKAIPCSELRGSDILNPKFYKYTDEQMGGVTCDAADPFKTIKKAACKADAPWLHRV